MGFEPLEWYCRPVPDGFWAKTSSNALGAYTPCGVETVVLGLSYLVLVGLFSYRMWRTLKDTTIQKFHLKSKTFNYVLGLLALYCTIGPLIRLFMGLSLVNFDGEIGLPPFEIVTLILQSVAWCFVLVMIAVETKIYIREFRWYVRFGLLYLLVAETIMFNIVLPNIKLYDPLVFYTYASGALCELLFGILLLLYIPNLESFTGYMPIPTNNDDTEDYEVLPGSEEICPENRVNLLSRILFTWITPVLELGYKRPITEKDIWLLDKMDKTETLYSRFQKCWLEEAKKPNPWLLRALHSSLWKRFWLGGLFKIGNDISHSTNHWSNPGYSSPGYSSPVYVGIFLKTGCSVQTVLSGLSLSKV